MSTNASVDDFDVEALVAAKSDQLNADDLMGGPITVRVQAVKKGKGPDQPMDIHIEGYRPWKPCKGMRRVLIDLWGKPSPEWLGRTLRLYREPTVKWAGEEAGGIRLSGMSDIKASCTVPVAVSRGVKVKMRIEKLTPPSANQNRGQAQDPRAAFLAALPQIGLTADVVTEWLTSIGLTPASADDYRAVYATLKPDGTRRAAVDAFIAGRVEGGGAK